MIAVAPPKRKSEPPEVVEIRPQPRQEAFLASPADLTFYGGAAFGGKTYAALLELMRWVDIPEYRGVIFRRTCPEITQEGGLWDESQKLYRAVGGVPLSNRLLWRFPSGAVIGMKHCQYPDDVFKYKGMQADVITIDQGEEFEASQFWYLFSRNRGSSGIRSYMRITFNPQPGWVADFLQWWWNPHTGYAIEERGGVIRWFCRLNDQVHWADSREELKKRFGGERDFDPKTCTFIPANAEDNPIGLKKNPGYIANMMAMRHVDKERLLHGNFLIVDDAGAEWPAEYFDDIWAEPWPENFELSTTAVDISEGGKEGDYSAIVFGGLLNGVIYIDSDIKRRPVPDIVADAAGMCIANRSQGLAFEGNGFQKLIAPDYERYIRAQSLAIPSAAIIENYGVNKVVRIKRLGGWLKGRRFRFRRNASNQLLLQQLRTFPLADHDDGPDAMEMMVRDLNAMAAGMMQSEG